MFIHNFKFSKMWHFKLHLLVVLIYKTEFSSWCIMNLGIQLYMAL